LLLYGSVARRRPSPDSDLDLLILLNRPFDFFDELRRIVDLLYPIQLESDRLNSAKSVAVADSEQGCYNFTGMPVARASSYDGSPRYGSRQSGSRPRHRLIGGGERQPKSSPLPPDARVDGVERACQD
jgi:hypothetical protein